MTDTMAVCRRAAVLIAACVALRAGLVQAQPNLLSNGDFEADAEGVTTPGGDFGAPGTIVSGWRVFSVGGAGGQMTVTAAAGRTGKGLEVIRQNASGDSAVDLDDPGMRVVIPAEPRVYKFTVDARDGGPYGTPLLNLGAQFQNNAFNRGHGFDPGAEWQTFGMTARSDGNSAMSVRMDVGGAGRSVHLDNARLVDATYGVNRMINGGFENSSTGLPNWRFFSVGGTAGSVALSDDAASGSNSALLSVTADAGGTDRDIGLDIDLFRMAVLGGEELEVSFASKKVALNDTRIRLEIAGFNAAGTYTGSLVSLMFDPGMDAYETFLVNTTVPDHVAFVNVAFRVTTPGGVRTSGAYLIDDVSVIGIPEPVSLLLLAAGGLAFVRRRR